MRFQNGKKDLQAILSWFSESFSRPSFKLFTSFIISFIQLGKEGHTSSMVQSLTFPFLHRSLPSFTRFLGQNRCRSIRCRDRCPGFIGDNQREGLGENVWPRLPCAYLMGGFLTVKSTRAKPIDGRFNIDAFIVGLGRGAVNFNVVGILV